MLGFFSGLVLEVMCHRCFACSLGRFGALVHAILWWNESPVQPCFGDTHYVRLVFFYLGKHFPVFLRGVSHLDKIIHIASQKPTGVGALDSWIVTVVFVLVNYCPLEGHLLEGMGSSASVVVWPSSRLLFLLLLLLVMVLW